MTDQRLVITGVSFPRPSGPLAPLALRLDAPVVALYGRNGAGKTHLINGLRFAAGDPEVQHGDSALHIEFIGNPLHGSERSPRAFGHLLHRRIENAVRRNVELMLAEHGGADLIADLEAPEMTASLPELTAWLLQAAGLRDALASAIADQEAWTLDRSPEGYYLSIAVRLDAKWLDSSRTRLRHKTGTNPCPERPAQWPRTCRQRSRERPATATGPVTQC